MARQTIAYVMSRFPNLSETFILREMINLDRQGWEVTLYPLIFQKQSVVHSEAKRWFDRVCQIPFFSFRVIISNSYMLIRHPYTYSMIWKSTLWENRTSFNFLIRALMLLPKAVHAAHLMEREGVSHIHAHFATHPAFVAWVIHRITGIRYSVTVHAHDIFVRKSMLATKLREAAFIVAISDYNREYLTEALGSWVRAKTHVIHCGIMPEYYKPIPNIHHRNETFEIMSIGSLQPYKGHSYLIQACVKLRDRGIPIRCCIIGDGEERPKLEQMIAEMRLEEVVKLLGSKPQEEIARILPEAHCYVQPSIITSSGKMEGIPVALMEAMACNLPVVATDLSGIPELVRPGDTGYLVPPADAESLAREIETVYADPAGASQLAENGRALVLQEFDLTRNVKRLSALFKQYGLAPNAPNIDGKNELASTVANQRRLA